MAGRRLPWWLVGVSIIATAFSSISLLGWTDLGFRSGPQWIQLQAGELAAIVVVCLLFLPFFSRFKITTAYEYLERRFGPKARKLASALFHVQVLARAGLFLYLTASALAKFTDLDDETSIVIVGLAAMIYSSAGGLGAVVWTDGLQMLLVLTGVVASIVIILGDLPGGISDVLAVVNDPQRPPPVSFDPDPGHWPSFWTGLLAYGVLALSVAGTNQQAVQRYMACKDLRASRRAALLSWALGAGIVLLTLGIGVALKALWGNRLIADNEVFTTFVSERLPTGLAGIMIAAIFAASMSSIDSSIHAMSTATLLDFIEPARRTPLDDRARLRTARMLTLIYGVLAIGAAFYALSQDTGVIKLLLRWLGFLGGPILGLFLLGMLTRRVRERDALFGVGAGYLLVVAAFTDLSGLPGGVPAKSLGFHGLWAAAAGCLTTLAVGILLSRVPARRRPVDGD